MHCKYSKSWATLLQPVVMRNAVGLEMPIALTRYCNFSYSVLPSGVLIRAVSCQPVCVRMGPSVTVDGMVRSCSMDRRMSVQMACEGVPTK
eukprot:6180176-Amphidinium_carterae.1